MRQDISNQGIERALARAVERSTPDIREKVASAPIVPLVVPDGIVPQQEERREWLLRAAERSGDPEALISRLYDFAQRLTAARHNP